MANIIFKIHRGIIYATFMSSYPNIKLPSHFKKLRTSKHNTALPLITTFAKTLFISSGGATGADRTWAVLK